MSLEKPSVPPQHTLEMKKSTLGRNPVHIQNVDTASVCPQLLLSISRFTLEIKPLQTMDLKDILFTSERFSKKDIFNMRSVGSDFAFVHSMLGGLRESEFVSGNPCM